MNLERRPSRRAFLRAALATPVMGATAGCLEAVAQANPADAGGSVISRITLDREVYDSDGVLNGRVSFRLPASGPVIVRWVDSFDRVVQQVQLPLSSSRVAAQDFSFELSRGLTYRNWIRASVGGVEQAAAADFLLSPAPKPWVDFHVISWAHYPSGFYDLLRRAGVDGTIAYRDGNSDNVLDNNFNFYVEQMVWEVFAIYHKKQPLWRVVGALSIGVAEELSLLALSPAYRTAVGFAAILLVLTLRPRGILGERAY